MARDPTVLQETAEEREPILGNSASQSEAAETPSALSSPLYGDFGQDDSTPPSSPEGTSHKNSGPGPTGYESFQDETLHGTAGPPTDPADDAETDSSAETYSTAPQSNENRRVYRYRVRSFWRSPWYTEVESDTVPKFNSTEEAILWDIFCCISLNKWLRSFWNKEPGTLASSSDDSSSSESEVRNATSSASGSNSGGVLRRGPQRQGYSLIAPSPDSSVYGELSSVDDEEDDELTPLVQISRPRHMIVSNPPRRTK